jgi:hypothetical protein
MGDGGAGAAQNAAMAQQSIAQRAFSKSTGIADEATVAGLANMDKALGAQERSLANQEKLLAQIDPTIMEASQQALKLLRGESSSVLAPALEQRRQQREKLLASLREQLGPGAETSTAGIQALNRFDSESNSLAAGQQQQALQNVGQTFGTFSSYKPNIGQEASTFGNLAQGRAGLQFQQAGVYQKSFEPLLQTAGAQYTADTLRGQQSAAFGNALIGGAAQAAGGYAMKKFMG